MVHSYHEQSIADWMYRAFGKNTWEFRREATEDEVITQLEQHLTRLKATAIDFVETRQITKRRKKISILAAMGISPEAWLAIKAGTNEEFESVFDRCSKVLKSDSGNATKWISLSFGFQIGQSELQSMKDYYFEKNHMRTCPTCAGKGKILK